MLVCVRKFLCVQIMSIAHRNFSELMLSWNVHEVSGIVDVYISQEIGMFHIPRDRNVSGMLQLRNVRRCQEFFVCTI